MSFAFDVIRHIVQHRAAVVPDPVIDRYMFGDGQPGPYPAAQTLNAIARLVDGQAEYDAAAGLLDERSRKLLQDLITFRALGPYRYALPTSTPDYMEPYARASAHRVGPSDRAFPPFLFEAFKFEHLGYTIEIEAWLGNIACTFLGTQYYLDAPRRIQPELGDVVIDGGGCFGDTALAFAASVGEKGRVFSFDPLPTHQEVMRLNFDRNPQLGSRIELVPHALSNVGGNVVKFVNMGAGSRMNDSGDIEARTDTIDQLVEREGLERVDFIKMDIEGAERAALVGARNTIAKHKPKLAISSYHSDDDLVIIPMLIKRLNPEYEIHLGHYTNFEGETVVYAA